MTLTAEERGRFAAYLRRDAETNRALAGQLEEMIPGSHLALKKLAIAEAQKIVAAELDAAVLDERIERICGKTREG